MRQANEPTFAEKQSSRTVLIVEDDMLQRWFVADEMRAVGFAVLEAASADEAVGIVQAAGQVDLMITDIDMPGTMDGPALISLVRKKYSTIHVVVASAHAARLRERRILVDAIFTKPYDVSAISATVRRLIGGQRSSGKAGRQA